MAWAFSILDTLMMARERHPGQRNSLDALGKLASANNSKVILMPLEASQVIGAVGGIADYDKVLYRGLKAHS